MEMVWKEHAGMAMVVEFPGGVDLVSLKGK